MAKQHFKEMTEAQRVLNALDRVVREGKELGVKMVGCAAGAVDQALDRGAPGVDLRLACSLHLWDTALGAACGGNNEEAAKEAHRYAGLLLETLMRECLRSAGLDRLTVTLHRLEATYLDRLEVRGPLVEGGESFKRLWLQRSFSL